MERNSGASLRPARNTAHRAPGGGRLFTLDCPHGCSEALTPNPDDTEVLAYIISYHTYCEGCECGGGRLLAAAAPRLQDEADLKSRQWYVNLHSTEYTSGLRAAR